MDLEYVDAVIPTEGELISTSVNCAIGRTVGLNTVYSQSRINTLR